MSKIIQTMTILFGEISDLLFPETCSYCSRHLVRGTFPNGICPFCFSKVSFRPPEFCFGRLDDPMRESPVTFPLFVACYYEELIRLAIRSLKFHGRRDFAGSLGGFLELFWHNGLRENLKNKFGLEESDIVIVPIPLHKKRLKSRGFNQVEQIAEAFVKNVGIILAKDVLERSKYTCRQSEMSDRYGRMRNVADAFTLRNTSILHGKTVILFDDVISSGATLWTAAKTIYDTGIDVIVLALAGDRILGGKSE